MKPNIAIDFDGVIHKYSKGWHDGTIYDEPVEGAAEALQLLSQKFNIVIFTARLDTIGIKAWIKEKVWDSDVMVTNYKPPAVAYIDDNAIRFTNWMDCLQKLEEYGER